jgi:hypothetical protein
MKIEVLYFEGCPNHRIAVDRVTEVMREMGIDTYVAEVNVLDEASARDIGFLGSPTIRINDIDVEPAARSSRNYGMLCRIYAVGQKREGAPPKDMIRAALREVMDNGNMDGDY